MVQILKLQSLNYFKSVPYTLFFADIVQILTLPLSSSQKFVPYKKISSAMVQI